MPPRSLLLPALLLAGLFAVAAPSAAQLWSDDKPAARNVAGEFDYYALVLSWSPTHCATPEGSDDDLQCRRSDGRRYAFILHGLWPQYENGYPSSCRTRRRPFVPQPLIDSMLDIMPSERLVIHEYRKHGTCSGLDPAGYYQLSRQLFQSVRIPERYTNPMETQYVSPDAFRRELVAENPGLKPDMIAISCARGGDNRLREIRICYSKSGTPQSCGRNEDRRRLCQASQIAIPPVRSSREGPGKPVARDSYSKIPLPGPRIIQSPSWQD